MVSQGVESECWRLLAHVVPRHGLEPLLALHLGKSRPSLPFIYLILNIFFCIKDNFRIRNLVFPYLIPPFFVLFKNLSAAQYLRYLYLQNLYRVDEVGYGICTHVMLI